MDRLHTGIMNEIYPRFPDPIHISCRSDDYMPYIKMICSIKCNKHFPLVFNHRFAGSSADQPSAPEAAFTQGLGQRWFTWVAAVPSWLCWCHASRPCGPFESPKFGVNGLVVKVKVKDGGEGMNLTILPKKNSWVIFPSTRIFWLKTNWFSSLVFELVSKRDKQKMNQHFASTRSPKVWHDEPGVRSFAPWPYGSWRVGRWSKKRRCRADFNWKHIHGKVGDFRWRNRDFDLKISQTQRLYSYIQSKCLETRNSKFKMPLIFPDSHCFFPSNVSTIVFLLRIESLRCFGTVSSFDSILSEQLEASPGNQSWAYVKIH